MRPGAGTAWAAPASIHLICPIVTSFGVNREEALGQELAPAFTKKSADRLLWRRRARPSATLDKMRTKL